MALRGFAVGASSVALSLGSGVVPITIVNPPAAPGVNIEFLRHWVAQAVNATSAMQTVSLQTQITGFGTWTAATPAKLHNADAVSVITGGTSGAAGTAGTNSSVLAAGSRVAVWTDTFNLTNGYIRVPTPPETEIFAAGGTFAGTLVFPVFPSVTTFSWGQNFREC